MEKIQPFDLSLLSGVEVQNASGQSVDLGSIFSSTNGQGIIIFRRHFNCYVCSYQLNKLIHAGPELSQKGFPVVIIAPEGPSGIAPYRSRYTIPEEVTILADPKKVAYAKLGFVRQNNILYNMLFDRPTFSRVMEGMRQARANGFSEWGSTLSAIFADVRQQGGILIPKTREGNALLYKQGVFEEGYPGLEDVKAQLEEGTTTTSSRDVLPVGIS